MKAVDTNILARLILADDPAQYEIARSIVREPVWVAVTVWLELGWVLSKRLKLDREVLSGAMWTVLAMETVHCADKEGLTWAINRFRYGADWADMAHLVAARDIADSFVTFDQALARHAEAISPIPVELVG